MSATIMKFVVCVIKNQVNLCPSHVFIVMSKTPIFEAVSHIILVPLNVVRSYFIVKLTKFVKTAGGMKNRGLL
jgi:hypothetical protein